MVAPSEVDIFERARKRLANKPGKFRNSTRPMHQEPCLDVEKYLDHYGVPYSIKRNGTGLIYRLEHCLFDPSHIKNDAAIIQNSAGPLTYKCFHNSCKDKDWAQAREKISGNESLKPFMKGTQTKKNSKTTPAAVLVAEGSKAELFHSKSGEAYAATSINGHRETWAIRSKQFKSSLSQRFYESEGRPATSQQLNDALNTLEGMARFEGPEREVHVRLAQEGAAIYLDLANENWEAVEITADSWRIIPNPPVRFRRTAGMLALPHPQQGGQIEKLRPYLNLQGPEHNPAFTLTVAWLLQCLNPNGPYPILVINGEQGTAKSHASKALRMIVDPNAAPLRSVPKNEHDLSITAKNSWILAFDNLSGLPDWLSDATCRLSTGGGFSTRELYSNDEETIFNSQRPIMLNGINNVATRHDLVDRCILITLPPIPEIKRQTEFELLKHFEADRPSILGGLLTALSSGLRNKEKTILINKPRMADFATFIQAAEQALPWHPGAFLSAYSQNNRRIVRNSLEEDLVSFQLIAWIQKQRERKWEGTPTELKMELEKFMPDCRLSQAPPQHDPSWPKDAGALSKHLRRCAGFLRKEGINTTFHDTRPRRISIAQIHLKSDANQITGEKRHGQEETANGAFDGARPVSTDGNKRVPTTLNLDYLNGLSAATPATPSFMN